MSCAGTILGLGRSRRPGIVRGDE